MDKNENADLAANMPPKCKMQGEGGRNATVSRRAGDERAGRIKDKG